jgi:predicted transcriptional regulator
MFTTIKVSKSLRDRLERMKANRGESYENVIEDMLEDYLEINPEFRKVLDARVAEAERGETISLGEMRKRFAKG